MAVSKKIKALKTFVMNTQAESIELSRDEIASVKFKDIRQFKDLLSLGNFEEAYGKKPVVGKDKKEVTEEIIEVKTENKDDIQTEVVSTIDDLNKIVYLCDNCEIPMAYNGLNESENETVSTCSFVCPICHAYKMIPFILKDDLKQTINDSNIETNEFGEVRNNDDVIEEDPTKCPLCGNKKRKNWKLCKECRDAGK